MLDESTVDSQYELKQWINLMDRNEWAVKYLGRRVKKEFWDEFSYHDRYARNNGFSRHRKFEWDGGIPIVEDRNLETTSFVHLLEVSFYESGDEEGRIKSIDAQHMEYWENYSNWQDHAEHRVSNIRPPTWNEIRQYSEILDKYTIKEPNVVIEHLLSYLEHISQRKSGDLILEREYGATNCLRGFRLRFKTSKNHFDIGAEELESVLCRLHFDLGAFIFAKGGVKYVLNLLDFEREFGIRERIDKLKDAFLLRLYKSSEQYITFTGESKRMWWRKARWRLAELLSQEYREFENGLILHGCAADVPRNYLDHDWFFFDPCWEIVNSVNGFCDLKEPPVISVQIPPVATQASGEELLDDEENSAIEEVDDIGHRGGYY